jgi:hypothetical protein
MYRMIMQEAGQAGALLPEWDKRSRMVHRVMERLIPASGLENVSWEVHVIESHGIFATPRDKNSMLTADQKRTPSLYPVGKSSYTAASCP